MNVVELTKSLISCPSVTPNNEGVLDLLQKELADMGFTCNRYLFSDTDTPDVDNLFAKIGSCLLYTSPSPRDVKRSRMPSSA